MKKGLIILICVLTSVAVFSVAWFHHSTAVENMCLAQARTMVPDNKEGLVPPTKEELRIHPEMTMIDKRFRAQLQCEKEHAFSGFF